MYDDVLLPIAIDEADDVDPALDRALDLSDRYGATLHTLHVVDPTVFEPLTVETDRIHEAMEEHAEESVETAAERAREYGVDAETRIGHGRPASVIVDYAADVDVVVMATHGREGLKRGLLGSVTEQVVRTSPAPVLTVPQ